MDNDNDDEDQDTDTERRTHQTPAETKNSNNSSTSTEKKYEEMAETECRSLDSDDEDHEEHEHEHKHDTTSRARYSKKWRHQNGHTSTTYYSPKGKNGTHGTMTLANGSSSSAIHSANSGSRALSAGAATSQIPYMPKSRRKRYAAQYKAVRQVLFSLFSLSLSLSLSMSMRRMCMCACVVYERYIERIWSRVAIQVICDEREQSSSDAGVV